MFLSMFARTRDLVHVKTSQRTRHMMDLKHEHLGPLVSGGLRIALSHTATLTQTSGRICENNQVMEKCLHDYCVCLWSVEARKADKGLAFNSVTCVDPSVDFVHWMIWERKRIITTHSKMAPSPLGQQSFSLCISPGHWLWTCGFSAVGGKELVIHF